MWQIINKEIGKSPQYEQKIELKKWYRKNNKSTKCSRKTKLLFFRICR
jgi:hypothetical protein